jgi:hypothetical protein
MSILGCSALLGSTTLYPVKDAPFVVNTEKGEQFDLALRPHESLGIRITPAILAGRVTVLKKFTISNKIFYSEEYPGRIRWNGWVVSPSTGLEYYAQIIRVGVSKQGRYEYKAIIDALPFELVGAKIVGLSSMIDFVSDFEGRTQDVVSQNYANEREYRAAVAMKFGTRVDGLIVDTSDFMKRVGKLNRYTLKDEGYDLYCEYSVEYFRKIAAINPAYGLMEKFTFYGNGQICIPLIPEPVTFASGLAVSVGMQMIDFMIAIQGESRGWDYRSTSQDNKTRAFVMLWLDELREKYQEALRKEIADLKRSKNDQPVQPVAKKLPVVQTTMKGGRR